MSERKDTDPVSKADKEIDKLSKSPLWVFGWGLVLTSLTFVAGVVLDLNEQNANIAKFNSLSHIYRLDDQKIEGTKKTLVLVVDATVKALEHFKETVQSQSSLTSIPPDVVDENLHLIAEARGAASAEAAVFSSLRFADPGLNHFVEGFTTDVEAIDEILGSKESICKSIKEGKFAEAQTELDKLKTRDYKKERSLNSLSIRVTAFDAETTLKKEEYGADLQLHDAHLKSFRYKTYLVLPLSGIVGAFAVFVIMRFRKLVI